MQSSSAIVVECVRCKSKLRVKDPSAGKKISCPKCELYMQVILDGNNLSVAMIAQPVVNSKNPLLQQSVDQPAVNQRTVNQPAGYAAPQQPGKRSAPPSTYYRPNAAPLRNKGTPVWLWGVIAGSGILVLVLMGFSLYAGISYARSRAASASLGSRDTSNTSGPATSVTSQPDKPLVFPELGSAVSFGDQLDLYRVSIARPGVGPLNLNIFIPKGQHADKSLPVMFECPSGTNLLHGADISYPKLETEMLPYSERGMITVTFSLDGPMPQMLTPSDGKEYIEKLKVAYAAFYASDSGVACGKLAIDYALAKISSANPKQLYIWGHSSAGTAALLLAAKDTRISRCIAMAPATNLNERLGALLSEPTWVRMLPNLRVYLKTGSPISHIHSIKCPVYLAHAQDDDNEPFENSKAFVNALKAAGGNVTFDSRTSGGHYSEMLNACIPNSVKWLENSNP